MDLETNIPVLSGVYQIVKHVVIVGVALFVAAACTGCATLAGEGFAAGDRGRILISADERGMQSFSDMFTGAVVTGKASPDSEDVHYKTRQHQDTTRRFLGWASKYQSHKPEHTKAEKAGLQRVLQGGGS